MPNITVTVSAENYRAARIWAAVHGTTVSAIVRKLLQNLPVKEEDLPQLISSLANQEAASADYLQGCLIPELAGLTCRPHPESLSPDPEEFNQLQSANLTSQSIPKGSLV